MPFFEAAGHDTRTGQPRRVHIKARNDLDAIHTATRQGIAQIELRPISDREILLMDLKCFLNASPPGTDRLRINDHPNNAALTRCPRSLLLEHPILTLTVAMLLTLTLNRLIEDLTRFL